jgi:hypothetical protein
VSEGHLGCMCFVHVTLVAAIVEDSLMMISEIYYKLSHYLVGSMFVSDH